MEMAKSDEQLALSDILEKTATVPEPVALSSTSLIRSLSPPGVEHSFWKYHGGDKRN
jgi:hypothetical protein